MSKDLTLKELLFLQLYTNPGNRDTFSNKTESYVQAYGIDNRNLAGVKGHLLLRKGKIKKRMEDLMEQSEVDFGRHLKTLDKKLDTLAGEGKISKEELMAIRLGLEVGGKLNGKGQTVQIAVGNFGNMDLDKMELGKLWDLQRTVNDAVQRRSTEQGIFGRMIHDQANTKQIE